MKLACFRHGKATSPSEDAGLSDDGKHLLIKHARLLIQQGTVTTIFSSPLKRAVESARVIQQEVGGAPLVSTQLLMPQSDPSHLAKSLENASPVGIVVVVGHEPLLSHTLEKMIGLSRQPDNTQHWIIPSGEGVYLEYSNDSPPEISMSFLGVPRPLKEFKNIRGLKYESRCIPR